MSRPPHRFSKTTGFSLVEMMISIVVGLVVVAGVISIFSSAVKSHTDNLRMTRLNQELRTTMNLMTRELRRAGFWGGNKQGPPVIPPLNPPPDPRRGAMNTVDTPGTANDFAGILPITGGSCITFEYDEDNNGFSATTERRGFQLDGGAVESGTDTGGGCGTGTWNAITDSDAIVITGLTFFAPIPPVDIDGLGPVPVPCTPTSGCPPGTSSIPPNPQTVPVNQIDITLTGHLAGDASVTRTLRETVRVYQ
ncbi:MAG: prepilin-type N-terminal cleavage/methylation domain-containing protein [Gammaproteobacteria bacterium]|nr:prepilin-type N-terminal cleavage/methylation domain-containing protein [Gammaproteobacteria bacterium]